MKYRGIALALATLLAGVGARAWAATVTYSTAISGGSGVDGADIDKDDFATFTQFNPALGTLNSVTMSFSLNGKLSGSLNIYASKVTPAGSPVTVSLSPVANFYYPGDPDYPPQSENRMSQTATLTAPMPTIDSSTNPYATGFFTSQTFPGFTITDNGGLVISSAGVTGTGTVKEEYYDPYLWGILMNQTDPNATVYYNSNIYTYTGTASLTYDYTPAAVLLGDANGDGNVDLTDLHIVLSHLGMTSSLRADGNFDGSATIDLNDLNAVLNHLSVAAPAESSDALSGTVSMATPEPSSLALLAVGGLLTWRRRRAEKAAG